MAPAAASSPSRRGPASARGRRAEGAARPVRAPRGAGARTAARPRRPRPAAPPAPVLPAWEPVFPEVDGSTAIEVTRERRHLPVVFEVPALVVVALLFAFLFKTFLAQAFFIPSASMVPTLQEGDRVVVSRLSYQLHDPRRGDVVVFESPRGGDGGSESGPLPVRAVKGFLERVGILHPSAEDFIKRVVALPGERVAGRKGKVFVNGKRLREPYLDGVQTSRFGPVTVPEDHVFVMGDNRPGSSDSREFGPIPVSSIVGRAIARVWPPGRVGFL